MISRVRYFSVSNTAVQVLTRDPGRRGVTFIVGNSAGTGSVMLNEQDTATTTAGLPVSQTGGPLKLDGAAAARPWSAIRLAAADCILGVIEDFDDEVPLE